MEYIWFPRCQWFPEGPQRDNRNVSVVFYRTYVCFIIVFTKYGLLFLSQISSIFACIPHGFAKWSPRGHKLCGLGPYGATCRGLEWDWTVGLSLVYRRLLHLHVLWISVPPCPYMRKSTPLSYVAMISTIVSTLGEGQVQKGQGLQRDDRDNFPDVFGMFLAQAGFWIRLCMFDV